MTRKRVPQPEILSPLQDVTPDVVCPYYLNPGTLKQKAARQFQGRKSSHDHRHAPIIGPS